MTRKEILEKTIDFDDAINRIVRLEKESAELKKEVLEVRQHLDLTEREWGKDLDKQIHFKTLCTKLEKENAELKEKLGNVQMQKAGEKSDLVWKLKTANEQKADQLTYAKELLAKWVELFKPKGGNIPPTPIQVVTEQFLSEVKKCGQ